MWKRRVVAVTWLSALLVIAACGGMRASDDPFQEGVNTLVIEVENYNFLDATIYAVAQGVQRRLGTVTGKGQETFRMRWDFTKPLRMRIDLLAGGGCITNELLVNPGEIVHLVVEADLDRDPDCR